MKLIGWALGIEAAVHWVAYTPIVVAHVLSWNWGHDQYHHLSLWLDDMAIVALLLLLRAAVSCESEETPAAVRGAQEGSTRDG